MRHTNIRALAVLAVCGLSIATAACGDDDDDASAATPPELAISEPTSPATTATTSTPATGDTVDVVLSDYAFGGLPESVPAGTRLHVENTSKKEMHELVAFRIPDDEKRTVDELLELPESDLEGLLGGPPATVLLAPPGGEQIAALGDGTLSEPGRYLILCAIPTGADPAEYMAAAAESTGEAPQVDGGPPHLVHGMHAELVVE